MCFCVLCACEKKIMKRRADMAPRHLDGNSRWWQDGLHINPLCLDVYNKAIKRSASTSAPLFFHYAAICITSRVSARQWRISLCDTRTSRVRVRSLIKTVGMHFTTSRRRLPTMRPKKLSRKSETATGERINFYVARSSRAIFLTSFPTFLYSK